MPVSGLLSRVRAWREPRGFGSALLFLSLLPAAYAIFGLASDILRGTRIFGSNPIKEAEHFLGEWILRFLVLTLLITPLRHLLKWNWIAKHRRTLGLFAFGYGVMHWLVYMMLDIQLDLREAIEDVSKRPYIIVGSLGLFLMLPLAVTSTKKMIARLGGKRWNQLHRLVYVSCILGVIHFWMSVKADIGAPLTFAVVFAVLFAYRIWKWRQGRAAPAAA